MPAILDGACRLLVCVRGARWIHSYHPTAPQPRGAMALAALSGDEQRILFTQLCNVLDPGLAVAFGSINSELRALTPALLQQLKAD